MIVSSESPFASSPGYRGLAASEAHVPTYWGLEQGPVGRTAFGTVIVPLPSSSAYLVPGKRFVGQETVVVGVVPAPARVTCPGPTGTSRLT